MEHFFEILIFNEISICITIRPAKVLVFWLATFFVCFSIIQRKKSTEKSGLATYNVSMIFIPYFLLPCMSPKHDPNLLQEELAFFFLDTKGNQIHLVLFLDTQKWRHYVCECKVYVCSVHIGPTKFFLDKNKQGFKNQSFSGKRMTRKIVI